MSESITGSQPLVIAHRGASGYLPEHTLAAKALAHAMGADFLEQDVVLTADGVPIVHHDLHLDHTTDVAHRFPERRRADGHYYAMDFHLEEIQLLRVFERSAGSPPFDNPVFPGRFPPQSGLFRIPTLAEELEFTRGLNISRRRRTGVYIELKEPAWHHREGADVALAVMRALEETHFCDSGYPVFLQCFDRETLQRLHGELKVKLPLIQLLNENSPGVAHEEPPLESIASYATGIGPSIAMIYRGKDESGAPELTQLVAQARRLKLLVHPYTFRRDRLPAGIENFRELLELFTRDVPVDGFFTDFPDLVRRFLDERHR